MEQRVDNHIKLKEIANNFVNRVVLGGVARKSALVVALFGELGTGKTTFTQYVAEVLGIKERVLSPTFILERIYKLDGIKNFDNFIHIDAYRLDNAEDLDPLGWADILKNPKNIIFIEWADKVENILPKDVIKIRLKHEGGDNRYITIDF